MCIRDSGETVPTEQPKSPKPPKRLKKDSDADYEKKLEKYRELGHSMCVYNLSLIHI